MFPKKLIISSSGDSKTISGGFYKTKVFGTYGLHSVDELGNSVYYANIGGQDNFLYKQTNNKWMVSLRCALNQVDLGYSLEEPLQLDIVKARFC